MKQYSGILQRILCVIMSIMLVFSFVACDDGDTKGNEETQKPSDAVVMTIHGYDITKSVYTIMLYNAAVELKMNAEPEEDLTGEEYDAWFFNFYNIEIDGKMPFDIVRENVLDDLKEYAYYMQAVEAAGLSMSDADKNDIETNLLISAGDDYDAANPDDYFVYTYGVTKDQYVEYMASQSLIDSYIRTEAAKERVSPEDVSAYLENYRPYYTVWSIQNLYLAATTEDEFTAKDGLGEQLAQRIRDGEDMQSLIAQYSEDGSNGNGMFTVSKDESEYPASILEWVYTAEVNQVGVVRAEDGVYVLKCVTMELEADANDEVQLVLGTEQLQARVDAACQSSDYTPVLNDTVYHSFTKLPGDLMMGEDAVG